METIPLTTNLITNQCYHTIVSTENHNEMIPLSCGLFMTTDYNTEALVIGMIPQYIFPSVNIQPAKYKVAVELKGFVLGNGNVDINSLSPKQILIYSLTHLFDKQMDVYAKLFKDNRNIKEKYFYQILYCDFDSEYQLENKNNLGIFPIYATLDRKIAKMTMKQLRQSIGGRNLSMCKIKTSKLIDIVDKKVESLKEEIHNGESN